MNRWLPYPLLTISLLTMWLLLNEFSVGHFILGSVIAVAASLSMKALEPSKPQLRRWRKIPQLLAIVLADIATSNVAVSKIIFAGKRTNKSGFVMIPLQLRDPTGLALLACIITSTPGTAWLEYNSSSQRLLIHVLDLRDERETIDLIKTRYESILMEIFE